MIMPLLKKKHRLLMRMLIFLLMRTSPLLVYSKESILEDVTDQDNSSLYKEKLSILIVEDVISTKESDQTF